MDKLLFKNKNQIKRKNVKQTSNESAEKDEKQTANQSKEEQPVQQANKTEEAAETLTVKATAYTADCEGCSGITATGINLNENPNKKVIAVDPDVIPLGTKVWVEGYGEAIAGDTGGAINGNRIDVHVPTKQKAYDWGVRTVEVKILD
ncbi:3D domain-containing protein [Piscibacillus salipiscarius]|uniref:3D domain-containing protein n=1 Tax=Piscibacillus salipiscarius TaxID=299480 RepID=UPI0024373808|nr:3D domain-containing protein [Piscibacillus salipiscarius]